MRAVTKATYPFTPDERANALLAADGSALLIGLCLEQQVRSEKAMLGPYEVRARLGTLDAREIARMPPERLTAVFSAKPAIHRFPNMMAKRVRALCTVIADEYGNRGARVWAGVSSAKELYGRLRALPGFGEEKAAAGVRILAKFGKLQLSGWQGYSSDEALPWLFKNGKRVS